MRVAVAVVVGACASNPTTPPPNPVLRGPLAELPATTVIGVIDNNGFQALLYYASESCTSLATDASATFQGIPMRIIDALRGTVCQIELLPVGFDPAAIGPGPYTLSIADDSATWTIDVSSAGAFSSPGTLHDGATATSTWNTGTALYCACVSIWTGPVSAVQWASECSPDCTAGMPTDPGESMTGSEVSFVVPSRLYEMAGAAVDVGIWAMGQEVDVVGGTSGCLGPVSCRITARVSTQLTGVAVAP